MIIKNHIAYHFLTNENYVMDMVTHIHPKGPEGVTEDLLNKMAPTYELLGPEYNQAFYVTNTVMDLLEMLKIKKVKNQAGVELYDWTMFDDMPENKRTFIFNDNSLLRVLVRDHIIQFCHLSFEKDKSPGAKYDGESHWVIFYINRKTGEQCDHFNHPDVKKIELMIYRLLCFIYLSENEEIKIEPGRKYGTRRSGKFLNSFNNIPVTIINSKWNITSIRNEGFKVSGHIRRIKLKTGKTRKKWIDPFDKKGYIRRAKIESEKTITSTPIYKTT